ncbi:hypothetical protein NC653_021621 [Populus alba x Populus x berolinensis]|uniref:Uncharacterized protein n=1 Tax=Populus alba x Populus x berolinensis TaxID=444605 RepID=A0AAD6MNE4_9ROSI|nr:hypothetical protein NC653_021621 [Populus alba x Populus x berolinensis]
MLVELGFDLFRRWWDEIGDFVTTNKSKIAAKAGVVPYRHADSFPLLPFVNFSQILFDSACPLTSHGPKRRKRQRKSNNPTYISSSDSLSLHNITAPFHNHNKKGSQQLVVWCMGVLTSLPFSTLTQPYLFRLSFFISLFAMEVKYQSGLNEYARYDCENYSLQ